MEEFFENLRDRIEEWWSALKDADISKLKFKVVLVSTIIGIILGFSDGLFIITLFFYLLPFFPDGIKKWFSFFNNGCLIGALNFFLFPYIIPTLALYYAIKGFMAIIKKNFNNSNSYFDSTLSSLIFNFGSSSSYYGSSSFDYSSSSGSGFSSSSGSGRLSPEEIRNIMMALYNAGESCNTCRHNNDRYGDCPYEDIRGSHQKININGVEICHKHSNAWNYR